MKVLIIDNFDSFVFTLDGYLKKAGCETAVIRNNDKSIFDAYLKSDAVLISPGPGNPSETSYAIDIAEKCVKDNKSVLGVCLGHQALGMIFGAKIISAKSIMHGKIDDIYHTGSKFFKNIENPFKAARYHSLAIDINTMPDCLKVTAQSKDKEIMAFEHAEKPIWGVQYHPESCGSLSGFSQILNWIELSRG